MKFALKIMAALVPIVAGLVLYVHGQICLFRISYAIDAKMDSLEQKSEECRRLKFDVDQLKAPRLLENQMKKLQLNLSLPKEVRVVKVPQISIGNENIVSPMPPQSLTDGILDFLGRWVKVAQAKMDH